ncbi:MAG: nucleotidyltransferase domain-containing protein [Candidatus Aenigmarchaeota archaeon]|nr:nucleotidyltransferase domain-containing protein [Candidatus Aenigmarchaeota archaeon]
MDKKISNIREYDVTIPYLGDYSKGFHIREIARKMEMNHRTVTLALNSLQRQGIVKHKTSGRNKVFFLNLDNPRTKDHIRDTESYRLGNKLNVNTVIKELYSSILSPKIPKTPIVLFGSYAKGDNDKKSDIDLLIFEKDENVIKAAKKFELKYDIAVHIQVISKKKIEMTLREKEPLILEISENHLILNNQDAFVNILWRYYSE